MMKKSGKAFSVLLLLAFTIGFEQSAHAQKEYILGETSETSNPRRISSEIIATVLKPAKISKRNRYLAQAYHQVLETYAEDTSYYYDTVVMGKGRPRLRRKFVDKDRYITETKTKMVPIKKGYVCMLPGPNLTGFCQDAGFKSPNYLVFQVDSRVVWSIIHRLKGQAPQSGFQFVFGRQKNSKEFGGTSISQREIKATYTRKIAEIRKAREYWDGVTVGYRDRRRANAFSVDWELVFSDDHEWMVENREIGSYEIRMEASLTDYWRTRQRTTKFTPDNAIAVQLEFKIRCTGGEVSTMYPTAYFNGRDYASDTSSIYCVGTEQPEDIISVVVDFQTTNSLKLRQ